MRYVISKIVENITRDWVIALYSIRKNERNNVKLGGMDSTLRCIGSTKDVFLFIIAAK